MIVKVPTCRCVCTSGFSPLDRSAGREQRPVLTNVLPVAKHVFISWLKQCCINLWKQIRRSQGQTRGATLWSFELVQVSDLDRCVERGDDGSSSASSPSAWCDLLSRWLGLYLSLSLGCRPGSSQFKATASRSVRLSAGLRDVPAASPVGLTRLPLNIRVGDWSGRPWRVCAMMFGCAILSSPQHPDFNWPFQPRLFSWCRSPSLCIDFRPEFFFFPCKPDRPSLSALIVSAGLCWSPVSIWRMDGSLTPLWVSSVPDMALLSPA